MARMRVHELAKELNMNNKELIERILKLGFTVKNHMSTLTETAVQKIRQQFSDSKTEKIEEKRIGRAVIRKRKRNEESSASPGELEETVAAGQPVEGEEFEQPVEALDEAIAEEAEAVEIQDESPPVSSTAQEVQPPVRDADEERAEEAAQREALPEPSLPQEEPVAKAALVAPPEEEITEVQVESAAPQAEESEPPVARAPSAEEISSISSEVEEPAIMTEQTRIEEPKPTRKAKPSADEIQPSPASKAEVVSAGAADGGKVENIEQAAEPTEDEEGKPRKAKKRRRKKARKDEPARIIKLPEIIIEEPEEEVELPVLAPRLVVKTDDKEVKEQARKKRVRPAEEFDKEAAEKKRKAAGRKEVVERENLYSKKELAAQADRGRGRDRGPLLKEEPLKAEPAVAKPGRRRVRIDEAITVASLAKQMGIKATELIKKLLLLGLPANINQAIDYDTAALLAGEFDFEVEKVGFEEEEILQVQEDREEDLVFRPPVITVMGHVDHGKTSLLDAIRDTNVIGGEAVGITQHIGAYYVKLPNGDVVFLDTPGHEAFTAMRARGAKVTDIVILVVAADDGVMQQTVEAINHAKAAQVPIIVAINKIDKPNANIDRVKRELSEHGLLPEEWGGATTMVEISAKKRKGIEELLEMVLLQAELMDLKASRKKPARGRVVEAKLDKGRGPVATILIQEGTLKTGDVYVCGVSSGRVRNMFSDRGQRLEKAGPATPVEVLGFSIVPNAGDDFIVLTDEKQAKMIAEHRLVKVREKELTRSTKVTLESLFEQIQEGEVKELNVILKTDVHGSLEAINESLLKLSTPEVKVNLIHNATGAITETDIMLAAASNAIVIGFNIRSDAKVQELADQEHVDMRYYDVIYQLLNDIKDAMVGMLEPVYQEHVLGRAEVRQTFHVPKFGTIAGCYVLDGHVDRGSKVRVVRDHAVIYDGKISSLRRFKDDAKEVKAGFECGIGVENFNDLKLGDILESYELQVVKPVLESDKGNR